MKYSALLLCFFLTPGCQVYRERFTYCQPDGTTNHIVDVTYRSCLMWGKAARLSTQTQTQEFIRSVNADGVEFKPDSESIQAITDGVTSAVLKVIKP